MFIERLLVTGFVEIFRSPPFQQLTRRTLLSRRTVVPLRRSYMPQDGIFQYAFNSLPTLVTFHTDVSSRISVFCQPRLYKRRLAEPLRGKYSFRAPLRPASLAAWLPRGTRKGENLTCNCRCTTSKICSHILRCSR